MEIQAKKEISSQEWECWKLVEYADSVEDLLRRGIVKMTRYLENECMG